MSKYLYVLVLAAGVSVAGVASANHSWGNYHWARTQAVFSLTFGDNVTSSWDSYLRSASADWNTVPAGVPKVINTSVAAGATSARNCRAVPGTVQVCNSAYGKNGWLGIAQIWINGSHITQGAAKMNDSYFNTAKYNTPAWRRLVMCQEVAHTFGLDHQDEAFGNANLGTCMDYTNAPAGGVVNGFAYGQSNEHPNLHDFEQIAAIYAHLDSFNSYRLVTSAASTRDRTPAASAQAAGDELNTEAEWGTRVRGTDGRTRESVYERDFGGGKKLITHVFWAE